MSTKKKYNHTQNLYLTLYRKMNKIIWSFMAFNCFMVFATNKGVVNGQNIDFGFLVLSVIFAGVPYLEKKEDFTFAGMIFDIISYMLISLTIICILKFYAMCAVCALEIVIFTVILYNDEYMKNLIKINKRRG